MFQKSQIHLPGVRFVTLAISFFLFLLGGFIPSSISFALAGDIPPTPVPISPIYGSIITPDEFPPVGIPEVTWTPVVGTIYYRVQFSNDIGFSSVSVNLTTPNTSYTPTALAPFVEGVWYWRVRVDSPTASEYSSPMEFTKQWATPTNFPVLLSPINGAELDFYDYPAFRWEAPIGAASYRFQMDTSSDFAAPLIIDQVTLAPSYQPKLKAANGIYYWRVVPQDAANRQGTPSEVRTVVVNYNNAPFLLAPADNSFPEFTPTFRWTAEEGAEYYRLEYSTNPSFPSNNTTAVTTRNTTYTPTTAMANDIQFYWRVRTHSGASISEWSAVYTFLKRWYIQPTLLTPTNNFLYVRFPFFSWTPVPGAARYKVEINDENNFNPPLCQPAEYTSQTYLTPNVWQSPCGSIIYWRVTPVDSNNNSGKPSATFSFTNDAVEGNVPELVYPNYFYTPNALLNPAVDRAVPYPIFMWERVTYFPDGGTVGSAYRLQFSDDPLFISNVWEYDTETTSATPSNTNPLPFTIQENTPYYWHVCVVATLGSNDCLPSGGIEHWSQRWEVQFNFSNALPGTPGNAPELLRPNNGNELVEFTPRLDWKPFLGATSYNVQISRDIAFTDIVDSATVPYPSYAPTEALAERHLSMTDYGTFYWRVKANNDPDWSDIWRFQIASQSGWEASRVLGDTTNQFLVGDDPDDVADNNFELTTLYASQDDNYWYIGFPASIGANMTYAVYLDLDYTDGAGATTDARGYNVTTIDSHHPEYILYVFQIGSSFSAANTALYSWTGSSWAAPSTLQDLGGNLDYSATSHLELQIPATAIGYSQDNGSINLAVLSLPGIGTNSNSSPTDVIPEIAGATSSFIDRFSVVANRPQLIAPFDNLGGDSTTFPNTQPFYYGQPTGSAVLLNNTDALPSVPLILSGTGLDMLQMPEETQALSSTPFTGGVLEAYLDPQFTTVVLHMDLDSNTPYYSSSILGFETDLQGDNSYYWRFRTRYNTSPEYFSAWSEGFRFERSGFIPENLDTSVEFATPTFSWDKVEGAERYTIQVDNDPNFGSPSVSIDTAQNSYTPISTLDLGMNYWRVRVLRNGSISNEWSAVNSFTITLPTPNNFVHYPGGVVGSAPTLCWDPLLVSDINGDPVLSAYKYRVQFSIDSSYPPGAKQIDTEQNCFTPEEGYVDGTYFWRVAMIDGNNRVGDYSPDQLVTKQYPITNLISPTNGTTLTSAPTFVWTPVEGAASYRLEISTTPTFATLLGGPIITNNVRYTPIFLMPNDEYYWRVAMVDSYNKLGPFTDAVIIIDPSGLGIKTFIPIIIR